MTSQHQFSNCISVVKWLSELYLDLMTLRVKSIYTHWTGKVEYLIIRNNVKTLRCNNKAQYKGEIKRNLKLKTKGKRKHRRSDLEHP